MGTARGAKVNVMVRQAGGTAFTLALGQRLMRARKARHLTQQSLAEASGFSITSICLIEKGQQLPPLDSLYSIAGVLFDDPEEVRLLLPKFWPVLEGAQDETADLNEWIDRVNPLVKQVAQQGAGDSALQAIIEENERLALKAGTIGLIAGQEARVIGEPETYVIPASFIEDTQVIVGPESVPIVKAIEAGATRRAQPGEACGLCGNSYGSDDAVFTVEKQECCARCVSYFEPEKTNEA